MAANKVIYAGNTLIDLSNDTITPEDIKKGITAHDKSGAQIVGTSAGSFPNGTEWTKSNLVDAAANGVKKYADGIWVQCSNGIYYSTDGKAWSQSNVSGISFLDLAYGSGVWVAASDSSIPYYSTDGKVWTQCTGIEGYLTKVVCSDGMWVAGSDKRIGLWYSEDGKSWAQSNITTGYQYIHAVRGNGMWVAEMRGTSNGIFYSTDGKTWTQSDVTETVFMLFYANGMWQADTERGLLYSFDGKTWSESNVEVRCEFIHYASGIWVGCMDDGLYYSTDGKVWIVSNVASEDLVPFCVAYNNGTWVATTAPIGVYYSTDGKTWTKSNDAFMLEMAYANGVWVGSQWPDTSEGSILPKPVLYSFDGKTWHESNITDDVLFSFTNNNGIWVAAGFFAGAYYSVTWEPTT